MADDIRIKISADETGAAAAFQRLRKEVLATEAGVKRVGQDGKAMGQSLTAAAQLLGPQFGQLGGQVSAMADALEKLPQAGLLAKAGLIGAVGAAGLFVGKTIGDWIFQTEKWAESIEKARAEFAKADAAIVSSERANRAAMTAEISGLPSEEQVTRRAEAIKRVQTEIAQKDAQIRRARAEIESRDWGMFQTGDYAAETANIEQNLKAAEARREMLMEQFKALNQINPEETRRREELERQKVAAEAAAKAEADRAAALKREREEQQKLVDAQAAYLDGLELERIRLAEGEEAYERSRLQRMGFAETTINEAIRLRGELARLREAEQQGMARRPSAGQPGTQAGVSGPGQVTATQQRFVTRGAGIRNEDKLLKAAEEQLAKAAEMLEVAKQQRDTLNERLPRRVFE